MTISKQSLFRCLVLASAVTLAACQQAAPMRQDAQPAAATQAAAEQPEKSAAPQTQARASSAPAISFFLAQPQADSELTPVQLSPEATLYALPQPVLTQADIRQVVPLQSQQGQVFLRFDFNDAGGQKLTEISEQAAGNYLILSINNQIVAVPQVAPSYQGNAMHVPMRSAEDAQAVASLLRQGSN